MVVFITSYAACVRFLEKHNRGFSYICFQELGTKTKILLDKHSCREIGTRDYSDSFKENFFMAYVNLIGNIGNKFNSIYWWASFTASKNRFMSKLLPNLLCYYTVCNTIKKNPAENMLLIFTPMQMTQALKQYCTQSSIAFKDMSGTASGCCIRVKYVIAHLLRMINFVFRTWIKIFLVKRLFRNHLEKTQERKEYYVLDTGVYPSSISNDYKYADSFFGKLPDYLTTRGNELLMLARITGNYTDTIKRLSKHRKYLIVPQEFFLGYIDVFRVTIDVYLNRVKFDKSIEFYGLDVSKIIQMEFDSDYTNTIRVELLQKYIIRNMLDYVNIHTFTTTYENNPWEKICFLYLKKYSPSTKKIGYQHAVISRASANMFVSSSERDIIPIPDKVITVGDITKDIMEKYGCYPDNRITPSCALRHEYIYRIKKKNFIRSYTILVALEGAHECYKLVDFVFNGLFQTRDYQVVIRTHPERPFDKIRSDLCFDIELHNNFTVSSKASLADDLRTADVLVYWGSTVSLEALMMGVPVIHVNLDDIISVDPLFDCHHLKWVVRNVKELSSTLSEMYSLSEQDYMDQYYKARPYVEKYLKQVTDNRLSEFII